MKTPKTVTTWAELEEEIEYLGEFYSTAVACLDDLHRAVCAQSEGQLRMALERWGDLKARPMFRVSAELWKQKATLSVVN